MWLPHSPARLPDQNDASSRNSMLLVQFWHELLDPQSPDAYQARTLDLALLLDDMLHVIEVASSEGRTHHHVKLVHDELKEHLKVEHVLLRGDPALRHALDQVSQAFNGDIDLGKIHRLVKIARGIYGDPSQRLAREAELLIAKGFKEKDEIRYRLSTIATHLLYRGMSEDALIGIDETCLDLKPEETLHRICSALSSEKKVFTCALAIRGAKDEITSIVANQGFPERRLPDLSLNDEVTAKWVSDYFGQYQTVIEVEGRSAREALEEIVDRLSARLNIHNLYLNGATLLVESRALIVAPDRSASLIEIAPAKHFGLVPRKGARVLTNDRLNRLGNRLSGRLANALECHSLALSATDPRTAITNLWTALEAISGEVAQGIGNHVARRIAPIIAMRRVERTTAYLSIAIHEASSFLGRLPDYKVLPNSMKSISADHVLEAITGPYKSPKIAELYRLSSESPLLCYRLNAAWRHYNSPSRLLDKFSASYQRIRWQIERLYRARNLLVHSGEQAEMTWRLLQQAQNYVSSSLSAVMRDMSRVDNWNVDDSLAYQSQAYEYVCKGLAASDPSLIRHADVLPNRTDDPTRKIWPNGGKSMFTNMVDLAARSHSAHNTKYIIHAFLIVETNNIRVFAYKADAPLIGIYAADGFASDMHGIEKDVVNKLMDAAIRNLEGNPEGQHGALSIWDDSDDV
jgi:hypothetical protein